MSDDNVIPIVRPPAEAIGNVDAGGAMELGEEIERFLHTIKDDETSIDSAGGFGGRDLWVVYKGREYLVNIRPSKGQVALEDGA